MSEPNKILFGTDFDNIVNDLNPINSNYEKLKQDLSAIRDKSTIHLIDRSNWSLNKLEKNTFDGFYHLIDLNLSYNILTYLPKGIFDQLWNLQTLNLSHNMISELELFIFSNSRQLITINLSNNLLDNINSCAFYDLPVLRKLDFSYNKIEKLLSSCINCKPLQELNLSFNQIYYLHSSAFWFVPNLINLQLNDNKISFLNKNIFRNTTKIEILNLSNNCIRRLILNTFANLHYLKQVNLNKNSISSLGTCFENKTMLIELNLLNNPLKTFWSRHFKMNKNIRTLKLTIYELQKLEKLKDLELLENFELHVLTNEVFPLHRTVLSWINKSTIQKLHLVINRGEFNIGYEIVNLFNLELLHIEFLNPSSELSIFDILVHINILRKMEHMALININKLKIIGDRNINETNLTYLNLTGIENESVDFLRNNFVMLEHLDLSLSNVKSIYRELMSTLPYLKFLIMNNTKISVIQDNVFQYNIQLEVIEFRDCQIHTIGENCFWYLVNLKQVDIRGNTQLRVTQSLLNGIPKSTVVYYNYY